MKALASSPLNIYLRGPAGRAVMDLVLSEPQAKIQEVDGVAYLFAPLADDGSSTSFWVRIPEGVCFLR